MILYFSHTGHTTTIASMIHECVGGELVEIKTKIPYPTNYDVLTHQAKEEQRHKARPELASPLPDPQNYDIIFLGYPNWWNTMPMVLFTVLEQYDFKGKTLVPFCTHGGSILGTSVEDIKRTCPEANVLKGLFVYGTKVQDAKPTVDAWINELKILS
ncbi:MAG: flavodoxin [Desulfovibrio sp.]|nr:flavodoxin [Desulfovibrio sp.]